MQERLSMMLEMQHQLQLKMPPVGRDPMKLEGDERAQYLRDMTLALEDELHEALNETGWKPWATSRHFQAEAFTKEMVDAWHFFMNLMLAGAAALEMTPTEYADYFTRKYIEKNAVNAQRQVEGYDGFTTKCPHCKRELTETVQECHTVYRGLKFCTNACAHDYTFPANHKEPTNAV